MSRPLWPRGLALGLLSCIIVGMCTVPCAPMTLQEARDLTRAAYEVGIKGDYRQAADLAKRVWEEFGNVDVRWLNPDSVLPYPNLDIYNGPAVRQAKKDAALRTYESLGKQRFYVDVRGIGTTSVLEGSYHHLKAWGEYEAYLKERLAHQPAEYRERVLAEFRAKPESFPRITMGPGEGAPPPPRAQGPVWVLARRAAEALEIAIAWDGEARAATFSRDAHLLLVRPGDAAASLDGEPFPLQGAPYIQNDRLILPLSALTQAFHITVTPLEQASVHYWLPK